MACGGPALTRPVGSIRKPPPEPNRRPEDEVSEKTNLYSSYVATKDDHAPFPPLHAHPVPDRTAPPLPGRQRRLQCTDPRRGAGVQGDRPSRGVRRVEQCDQLAMGGEPGGNVNVQGEIQKPLDVVSNQVFTRMNEWGGHLRRHGVGRNGRAVPDSRAAPARKILAGIRPTGRFKQYRRQRLGGQHLQRAARAGCRQRARRDGRRLSATRNQQVAAGYALYGPTTMFVLSVGNGVDGFTLDPNLGEFMLTHPQHRGCRPTRRSSRSMPPTAGSGKRQSSAMSTSAWPARPAHAARTSTCAGSPRWWPRHIAS